MCLLESRRENQADYLTFRAVGVSLPGRRAGTSPRPARGRRAGSPAPARRARAARRPRPGHGDGLQPADEQVVDRAGGGRGAEARGVARAGRTGRCHAGRRLRSPPRSSGASPAHSVARCAASSTSRRPRLGGWGRRSRAGWRRRARPRGRDRARVNAITRRSGRGPGVSSSVAPLERSRPRTRVRFEPPSPEAIRSGLRRASQPRSGAEPVARGQRPVRLGAAVAAASPAAQRGGHSCSRATSHSRTREHAPRTRRAGRG